MVNKTILATAVAITMTATIATAGVNFGGKSKTFYDVDSNDIVMDGTAVQAKFKSVVTEDLTTFGKIGVKVKADKSIGVQDSFVGLKSKSAGASVQVGRMKTLVTNLSDSSIDIFNGDSVTLNNTGRKDAMIQGSLTTNGVTLFGQSENGDGVYQIGASTKIDDVTVFGLLGTDKKDLDTQVIGLTTTIADFTISGTRQADTTSKDVETVTYSAVASKAIGGGNTVKGGYQNVVDGDDFWVAEVSHALGKHAEIFAGMKDTEATEPAFTLGYVVKF